jgi:hypothetical protein
MRYIHILTPTFEQENAKLIIFELHFSRYGRINEELRKFQSTVKDVSKLAL